jgi:hypothetical protein
VVALAPLNDLRLRTMTGQAGALLLRVGRLVFASRLGSRVHAFSTRWRYRSLSTETPNPQVSRDLLERPRNPTAGPFHCVLKSRVERTLPRSSFYADHREPADAIFVPTRWDFSRGARLPTGACSHREQHMITKSGKSPRSMLEAVLDGAALGVGVVAMVLLVGWWLVVP